MSKKFELKVDIFFEYTVVIFSILQSWQPGIQYNDKNNRYYARIKTDITRLATRPSPLLVPNMIFPVKSYKHHFPAVFITLLSPLNSHQMTPVDISNINFADILYSFKIIFLQTVHSKEISTFRLNFLDNTLYRKMDYPWPRRQEMF